MKFQKLSIYLIKEELQTLDQMVKSDRIERVEFPNGTLFYKKSFLNEPSWVKNFLNTSIHDLKNSTGSGLFISKINVDSKDVFFGISFGYGWHILSEGSIVEQFGIKTALSMISHDEKIKKIEKKNFKNGLKDVSEQLGQVGSVKDFGFDTEQDLLKAVVGTPNDTEMFGKNIVGKDAISLSVKRSITDISELLLEIYKIYKKEEYKKNFEWFDHFSSVKDKILIATLNNIIISKIRDISANDAIFWLSIPKVIEWENVKCFRYKGNNNTEFNDITFNDFYEGLSNKEKENFSLEIIKRKKVNLVGTDDQIIDEWSVFKCLYAEVDYDNDKYILISEKYYKVDREYKTKVENAFKINNELALPDWDVKNYPKESDYNIYVCTTDSDYQCLDGGADHNNLIDFGGRKKNIEFADILKVDGHIIHVKKYGGSAVFSHLFNQGFVSAELLKTESLFRKNVNMKLVDSHKHLVEERKIPKTEEYTIVYAVATQKNDLKLPFFSIVSFNNIKKQLMLYGYNVQLIKISQV